MKYFVSYKYVGYSYEHLRKTVDTVVSVFRDSGCESFCSLYYDEYYAQQNFTKKQIFQHCFSELRNCDKYVAFVGSDGVFNGGMALECGFAHGLGIPIIACIPKDRYVGTLQCLSDVCFRYTDMTDLCFRLKGYLSLMDQRSISPPPSVQPPSPSSPPPSITSVPIHESQESQESSNRH